MKKRSQSIEAIRKRYQKRPEWLLIRMDRKDESKGWLIAHSPLRLDIDMISMREKGRVRLYATHSTRQLPKGLLAAF